MNSYEIHSVGGESVSLIVPDEIFRSTILTNSRYFILIHNHPSGMAVPSREDKEVMTVLKGHQALIMHRHFLDFIIVGDDNYWSMFEQGDGGKYGVGSTS